MNFLDIRIINFSSSIRCMIWFGRFSARVDRAQVAIWNLHRSVNRFHNDSSFWSTYSIHILFVIHIQWIQWRALVLVSLKVSSTIKNQKKIETLSNRWRFEWRNIQIPSLVFSPSELVWRVHLEPIKNHVSMTNAINFFLFFFLLKHFPTRWVWDRNARFGPSFSFFFFFFAFRRAQNAAAHCGRWQ